MRPESLCDPGRMGCAAVMPLGHRVMSHCNWQRRLQLEEHGNAIERLGGRLEHTIVS